MKNKGIIIISTIAILLGIFLVGKNFYKEEKVKRDSFLSLTSSEIFVRPYSPTLGPKDAPVYLIEFLDPECESCRKFAPYIKDILKEYGDKIRLVVRYVPFHRNSKKAIAILEASRKQNKFFETLNLLFETQPIWADHHDPKPELAWEQLPEIGLDIEKMRKDVQDPKIQEVIDQDYIDAQTLHVKGTPTFFINGKRLEKFGLNYLKEAIEREISKH